MRLMSVVRSAALAVACLFPVSAAAAPDPLPEGLFDFSITYESNAALNEIAGWLGLTLNERLTFSGVMTLLDGSISAFRSASATTGSNSASLGDALFVMGSYGNISGDPTGRDINGIRFGPNVLFTFSKISGSEFIFYTDASGFQFQLYDSEIGTRTVTASGSAASLTPVPEIDGGRLSLALFVLATIGVAIAARRRRGGSEGVSHGPLATA